MGYECGRGAASRLAAVLVVLALWPPTGARAASVVVNGQPLPAGQQVINREGTLLLPMRAVFNALGAQVAWYPTERKIEARRGEDFVELWLGTPVAHVNRNPVQLNVPPLLIDGVTYVPLRFPGEALGATVRWEAQTKTAFLGTAGIDWLSSLEEGLKQAQALNRPVLIDFYAPWCGPCRMMDEETWPNADVVAAAGRFITIRLNVDDHQAEAQRFEIDSIPSVVFLDAAGREIGRSVGLVTPEELLRLMREHGAK